MVWVQCYMLWKDANKWFKCMDVMAEGARPTVRWKRMWKEVIEWTMKRLKINKEGALLLSLWFVVVVVVVVVSFQRPLLVILDRNMDLATPFHHTWTYQALAHDVLVSWYSTDCFLLITILYYHLAIWTQNCHYAFELLWLYWLRGRCEQLEWCYSRFQGDRIVVCRICRWTGSNCTIQ